jgi:hypothetical protein
MLDLDMLAKALAGEGEPVRGDDARREVTMMIHEKAEALMRREGLTRKEALQQVLAPSA